MLILRHLALVSAIFHQGTHALPVPLYINLEAPIHTQPSSDQELWTDQMHSFNHNYDPALQSRWMPSDISVSKPTNADTTDIVLFAQPSHWQEKEDVTLKKRGIFSYSFKSAVRLIKSAAKNGIKGGAKGVAKNGAKAMFQIERREIQKEEQNMIARSFNSEEDSQEHILIARNSPAALEVKKKQGLFKKKMSLGGLTNIVMLGSMLGPMATGVIGKLAGHKSTPVEAAPVSVAPPAPPAALSPATPPATQAAPTTAPPAGQHPPAAHPEAKHPSAQHLEAKPHMAEKSPARRSLNGEDVEGNSALVIRDVATPSFQKKGHGLRKFGRQSNKALDVAEKAAVLALVGVMGKEVLGKGMKKKEEKKNHRHDKEDDEKSDNGSADKKREKRDQEFPIAKRSSALNEADQALDFVKRGQVANAAGALVTTLMFVNIGKGALQAIMPHHKKNGQQYPPPQIQYPPGYLPQYSRRSFQEEETYFYKRQDHADDPRRNSRNLSAQKQQRPPPPPPPSRKAGVMEGMGAVVTLGFGWQALQEHIPAFYREIKRVGNAAMRKLTTSNSYAMPLQMTARSLVIQDDSPRLVGRDLNTSDEDGEVLQRRMPPSVKAAWPKILNGASHVVTVSMVTGMAGPLIDKFIKELKGPNHPDNIRANQMKQMMGMMRPMRRSLVPLAEQEEYQSLRQPLQPLSGSLFAQRLSSDVIKPNRTTGKRLSEDDQVVSQEMVLKKRVNLGRVARNVMKNKIVKGLVNTAITII